MTETRLQAPDGHYDLPPYLYARDTYPIHVRFPVVSNKPFNTALLTMQTDYLFDDCIIKHLTYDGQAIRPKFIHWPYASPDERIVKILVD